jgi:hypothetical protein
VIIDAKTGERVISDPNITISRIFLYFYMFISKFQMYILSWRSNSNTRS